MRPEGEFQRDKLRNALPRPASRRPDRRAPGKPWTRQPAVDRRIREDVPLTDEEQRLSVDALEHAMTVAGSYERAYGDLDFLPEVSLRIVRHIGEFNPGESTLKKWAQAHAAYACREVIRRELPWKARHHRRKAYVSHLGMSFLDESSRQVTMAALVPDDTPPPWEAAEDEEAARHLLRGLTPFEAIALYRSIVEGLSLREIGEAHGFRKSNAHYARENALMFLRRVRAKDYPERIREGA